MLGVLVGVLRVLTRVLNVRHALLAKEGRERQEERVGDFKRERTCLAAAAALWTLMSCRCCGVYGCVFLLVSRG